VGQQRVSRPAEFRAAAEAANGVVSVRITKPAGAAQDDAGDEERHIPAPH
jgi:hypothetical protein